MRADRAAQHAYVDIRRIYQRYDDEREEANRYAQYTLSVTQLEVVFVLTVRKTGLVHNVRADVVSPQECRNLKSLAEISGLVGYDIHIASPGTPKTKRTLVL
jgi:hypothetical protein